MSQANGLLPLAHFYQSHFINHFYKYPGVPTWENISIKFVDANLWGSGKTIVALIAMIKVFESNFQSALMVPTTILAFQHYENIQNLLKDSKINVLVLTGKDKGKERKEKLDQIDRVSY